MSNITEQIAQFEKGLFALILEVDTSIVGSLLNLFAPIKAALQNKVSDISAEQFLNKKGIFSLDTKKRYNEVIKWMEEYASIVNERKDSAGSWVKDSEVIKTVEFGDYISVEQKRYGCANEFYTHKVIGNLKSNVWMDVPAITHEGMSQHGTMEEIVACVCQGVCEEEVIRYRIKDINSIKKHKTSQPKKESK